MLNEIGEWWSLDSDSRNLECSIVPLKTTIVDGEGRGVMFTVVRNGRRDRSSDSG